MPGGAHSLVYEKITDSAPWSPRYGLGAAVFQDRLWVIAGSQTMHKGTQRNDVWSSVDGVTWKQELSTAPWPPRWGHAVFAFANRLWVIGGLADVDPIVNLNDIWSSPDGKTWRKEADNAPWTARHAWSALIHNGRMYLIAGAADGQNFYNDVISSADGVNWEIQTACGPWFEKRKCQSAASFGNKIWVTGGSVIDPSQRGGARYLNDVWSSADAKHWTQVTDNAPWSARCFHEMVEYKNRLWLIGGEQMSRRYATDIWSSINAVDWKRQTERFSWPPRHSFATAVFKDRVWILGGTATSRGTASMNDIWAFRAR